MREKILARKSQYFVLAFIVLCTVFTMHSAYSEICNNAINISKDKLSDNASLFKMYFNDTLKEKITNLETLSKSLDSDMLQDKKKLKTIASKYYRWFSSIGILDSDGKFLYGEKTTTDISKEEFFNSVAYGKQTLVYDNIVGDESNKECILVCTPIEAGGKTIGVLEGLIHIANLTEFLEKGEYTQSDCIFLMASNGEYRSDTKAFRKMVGKSSYNFYDFLIKCDMEGDITSVSDMESTVSKRKLAKIGFRRNGADYIGVLEPTEYGNWYIGFCSNIQYFHTAFKLGKTNSSLILFTLALWIGWIGLFGYVVYNSNKTTVELERYRVVQNQEKSIVFDLSFSPKQLKFFGDLEGILGYNAYTMRGEEVYDVYQYVHKDDASVRGRIHSFYDSGEKEFMAEVRIRNADGEYSWYRITGSLIRDNYHKINRNFIGKIVSADQQIAKEKNLVERSENDLLTGVLNKKTMEEKVIESFKNIHGSHHYVFFMVDLDNFKNVNDKLGHIVGDKAIVDTAECLRKVFTSNAHIGRLGGDEFAVCAFYDAFDEESLYRFIKDKAEKICEANRRTYENGGTEVHISSSVGIAVAPDFAQDFETIYKMADSALYRSKNGGKNCYNIYGAEK